MKVLFVASGNKKGAGVVSSFVQSQFDSLKVEGLDMTLFPVKGRGWRGYAKAVLELRRLVKREHPDIIHAHYSTCGFVASLATMCMGHKPKILVSILGSFPTRNAKWRRVRWAIQHLWDGALTKSERTRAQLGLNLPVIPNGVNLDVFRVEPRAESRKKVGFEADRKYIIWCSNPERVEKNWPLGEAAVAYLNKNINIDKPASPDKQKNAESTVANCDLRVTDNQIASEQALRQIACEFRTAGTDTQSPQDSFQKCDVPSYENDKNKIELIAVYGKTPEEVCTYMNAADCLLLTSVSEGSPNVIKEAMACNCPIVTTDVGDVRERLANLDGCYVVEEPMAIDAEHLDAMRLEKTRRVSAALEEALEFGKRTEGRQRMLEDGLTIEQTAKKIIKLYERI